MTTGRKWRETPEWKVVFFSSYVTALNFVNLWVDEFISWTAQVLFFDSRNFKSKKNMFNLFFCNFVDLYQKKVWHCRLKLTFCPCNILRWTKRNLKQFSKRVIFQEVNQAWITYFNDCLQLTICNCRLT